MAWVRIEDTVSEHRKHLKAGPAACWLWVCGIAYCQRQLSDGFIPIEAISLLGVLKGAQALAKTLVDVRLFDEVEGGYRVHDYHDYNATREEAEERKSELHESRARAGRLGGLRSGAARRAKQDGSNEAKPEVTPKRVAEAKRSPIPSHPIPSVENERAREDSPLERVTDAFRAEWKRLYGHESTLMLNHLQFMELEQQFGKCGEATFLSAMAAYFATDDPYVLKAKHPIGLFLRDPSRFLAKDTAITARPKGCTHEPRCADAAAHTTRYLSEQKAS